MRHEDLINNSLNAALYCIDSLEDIEFGDMSEWQLDKFGRLKIWLNSVGGISVANHTHCESSTDRILEEVNQCFINIDDDNAIRDDKIDDLNDQIHALRADLDESVEGEDFVCKHDIFHFLDAEIDRWASAVNNNEVSKVKGDCYISAYSIVGQALLGREFNKD